MAKNDQIEVVGHQFLNALYFLDLKENVRGRYLRVRAPGQTNDMPQQVIVVPASGMIEFRDTVRFEKW